MIRERNKTTCAVSLFFCQNNELASKHYFLEQSTKREIENQTDRIAREKSYTSRL